MSRLVDRTPSPHLGAVALALCLAQGGCQTTAVQGAQSSVGTDAPPPIAAALGDPTAPFVSTLGGIYDEPRPSPAFIKDDIPFVYNLPSPSQVKPELLGPVQLIRAARIDEEKGQVTLPLFKGQMATGETVWYTITDVSDENKSLLLGVNFSRKLADANRARGARAARIRADGTFLFERGAVNFAPALRVVAGSPDPERAFPPSVAQPGSVGDRFYTPIVKQTNGPEIVYNAPVLAYGVSAADLRAMARGGRMDHSKVHDKVVGLDLDASQPTVTLQATFGYSFAKPVFYLSTDANTAVAAALEGSTLAPGLEDTNQDLEDHHPGQTNERLFIVTNGPTGLTHPYRQGINSALLDGRGPINVFGGIPTVNLDYSPLWDGLLVKWRATAVASGYRTRLIDAFQIVNAEAKGLVEDFAGGPVRRSGIIINCPIIARLQ